MPESMLRQDAKSLKLSNSIEAVQYGGSIWVRTWYSVDNTKVFIEISDNGTGISREQMTKIFTPFFATKEKGSGLGLAFAHRIIRDHGGNISVSSVKGEKTAFLISLPACCQRLDGNEGVSGGETALQPGN